jgi:hypothetical protein
MPVVPIVAPVIILSWKAPARLVAIIIIDVAKTDMLISRKNPIIISFLDNLPILVQYHYS